MLMFVMRKALLGLSGSVPAGRERLVSCSASPVNVAAVAGIMENALCTQLLSIGLLKHAGQSLYIFGHFSRQTFDSGIDGN
jgi:hypothetical protein